MHVAPVASVASCVVGRWRTTHDAEHGWSEVGLPDHGWTATVFVPPSAAGYAEVAVVTAAYPDLLPEGARLFRFPGSDGLPDELTVAALVATTAVEDVAALGGTAVLADQVLRTQAFLRPVLTGGRVRLQVRPGAGATLLAFEQPRPTSCCADH